MALYLLREIRHIGIVVKNLDESMYFYKDLMGFEVFEQVVETGEFIEGILNIKNCMVTTVKMIHPCLNGMIELLWYDSPKAKYLVRDINDIGIGHIAFTVDDVMEKFDRLSKKHVPFISRPRVSSSGKAKVVFCQAPEGTYIELVEILK